MLVTYEIDAGWKGFPNKYTEVKETEDPEATRIEIWTKYVEFGFEWATVYIVEDKI